MTPPAGRNRSHGIRYLAVSGMPASGKSTLARDLGAVLQLPVIDKDDILEELFPDGEVARPLRHQLSRRADTLLQERVRAAPAAIAVSFWRRTEVSSIAGTPWAWLAMLPDLVEIHCTCSAAIASERFLQRTRHRGHGDHLRPRSELVEGLALQEGLGALGVGARTITVDTSQPVDIVAVSATVRGISG